MKRFFLCLACILCLALSIILTACGPHTQTLQSGDPTAVQSQNVPGSGITLTDGQRLYMVNAQVGWAIGGKRDPIVTSGFDYSTLMRTTDGGDHWQQIYAEANGIGSVYVLDENTAWIMAGTTSVTSFYRTSDGGQTWQHFPAPVGYVRMTFIDSFHGWAISDPCGNPKAMNKDEYLQLCNQEQPSQWSLLQTSDGGQTWQKVYATAGASSTLDTFQFLDQQTGFLSSNQPFTGLEGSFKVTHDGGHTWKQQTVALARPEGISSQNMNNVSVSISRLTFLNAQDGYLITSFTSQTTQDYLYVTYNGGQTWQVSGPTFSSTSDMGSMQILDAQHIVIRSGLANATVALTLLTLQNGRWEETNCQPAGKKAILDGTFASAQVSVVLLAANNTIDVYRTDDSGKTWQQMGTL